MENNFNKSKETGTFADSVFLGGRIFTMDKNLSEVEAVACRDGKIIAAGDESLVRELCSADTEIHDLEGKFMLPGFVDAHSTFILDLFSEKYLNIDPVWDLDTILREVKDYSIENYDQDVLFCYGFSTDVLEDYPDPEDLFEMLDEISTEQTIVLLAGDGLTLWMNTTAAHILDTTMADNNLEFLSPIQALMMLLDFDDEAMDELFAEKAEEWTERGFTSLLNLYSPEYFDVMTTKLISKRVGDSEPMLQRVMMSSYVNAPIDPFGVSQILVAKKTHADLFSGMLYADFLKLQLLDSDEIDTVPAEIAEEMCKSAAKLGFNVHIDAADKRSTKAAYRIFDDIRNAGYDEPTLVIATDHKVDKEFLSEISNADKITVTRATAFCRESAVKYSESIQEAVKLLTSNAAKIVGKGDMLGSIEPGKFADFAIFSENPFELTLKEFSRLEADATVIGGEVVYDVELDNMKILYDSIIGSPM